MLAAHRDQENRVLAHQAAGAPKQQLQAKTPGSRFPKTPLKIPLNDENANRTLGGKSVLQTKNGAGKSNMVTPLEPRTGRAPLGNKTTNGKARTAQQSVKDTVREFEKTQTARPTTSQKPRQSGPQIESAKLAIHSDANPLGCEEDVEYAPPRTRDLPYESDVLPSGTMTFKGLKKENMFKGYYQYYYNPVDENGVSRKEREVQEQQRRAFKKGDEQIRKDMQEFDWSVGDVPGSENTLNKKTSPASRVIGDDRKVLAARIAPRQPSTLSSRQAASALSMASKLSTSARAQGGNQLAAPKRRLLPLVGRNPVTRPALTRSSSSERATALAASRSTIGYSKGRTALTAMQPRGDPIKEQEESSTLGPLPRTFSRTVSTASSGSDVTITPARFARSQSPSAEEWKKLEFLSIFDTNEGEDDQLGVSAHAYESEDEFQLATNF